MEERTKITDDLGAMASGMMSLFGGLRQQVKEEISSHIDNTAQHFDLVPRADFEDLQAMVTKLRTQQEEMEKRLAALENTPAQK